MKTTESTLVTKAIYSDDNQHRYLLQKTWNTAKKKAMVIMIFPCSADISILDLTTMLVLNNLAQIDYGSVEILNLYSKTDANPSKDLSEINTPDNDLQIVESAKNVDSIIIAWGKGGEGSKKISARQNAILRLLLPYKDKTLTTVDERGIKGLHPLTPSLRSKWWLEKFDFTDLKDDSANKNDATGKEETTGKKKDKKAEKQAKKESSGEASANEATADESQNETMTA